jgi:PAS domain S-box-containing protein
MTEQHKTTPSSAPGFKRRFFADFERMANHSQDAIYHYDIDSQRFLFHNQQFRRFFRLHPAHDETVPADNRDQIIHPDDREQLKVNLTASLRDKQEAGEAEYRVLYPDGSILWLQDRWIVIRNAAGRRSPYKASFVTTPGSGSPSSNSSTANNTR